MQRWIVGRAFSFCRFHGSQFVETQMKALDEYMASLAGSPDVQNRKTEVSQLQQSVSFARHINSALWQIEGANIQKQREDLRVLEAKVTAWQVLIST